MRLLVTADLHLGSPIQSVALRNPDLGERLKQASRDTFVRIVDLAITERVDALVLGGDLFDSDHPDLRSRAFLIAQLTRAVDAGVPCVLIRGNHDALLDHTAQGDLGDGIHLLHRKAPSVRIGAAVFHGLSYDAAHVARSFLPDYPPPVPGRLNVGVMHTSLDGAPGHDPYAPCAARDLMAHGYDLWCLGHIHAPFDRVEGPVAAVMPGIPQPRHIGERTGGSVALVTLGDGAPRIERRAVGHLVFDEGRVDLTACADQQAVQRALRDAMAGARRPGRDVALRLAVTSDRIGADLVAAMAREQLDGVEGVFLDKVRVGPPPPAPGEVPDDLLRLMQAEMAEDGFREEARLALEELRLALPAALADVVDDAALDGLLQDALAEVTLTLHAAEGA